MTSKFVCESMLISSLMEVFDGIAFSTVTVGPVIKPFYSN